MIFLKYPFDEKQIRALKVGDTVSIEGSVITGRDKFHKYFADGKKIEIDFKDGALYHCGPVIVGDSPNWRVVSAGPTTSVRENPYEPAFIEQSGVRIIIGKGGMNDETLEAMKKFGCVYIQAVGGAAAIYAEAVERVASVSYLKEFGAAEACWHFEVKNFTGIVAMDSHGESLFKKVQEQSAKKLAEV